LRVWWGKLFSEKTSSGLNKIPDKPCSGLTRGPCKYDGEWKDEKKNGKGVYKFANGGKYEGEWKDGNKHGKGIYISANGDKYDAEYKDGV
jgi:hypothetical protein